MNYGLALSLKMEIHLTALEALEAAGSLTEEEGQSLEDRALQMAIEEVYEANGKKWKPWACNGRSLRVGDVILICDSDTIVPEVIQSHRDGFWYSLTSFQDCFRDAARELHEVSDIYAQYVWTCLTSSRPCSVSLSPFLSLHSTASPLPPRARDLVSRNRYHSA